MLALQYTKVYYHFEKGGWGGWVGMYVKKILRMKNKKEGVVKTPFNAKDSVTKMSGPAL